jgi:pilus assembly protein Flp/PilA
MNNFTLKIYVKAKALRDAFVTEDGQDLIEYALVAALIAFGSVAAMKTLATNISTGFTSIGGKITTYTS